MGVELRKVCYEINNYRIFNELSFEIKSRKNTFIVGESGCGKSLLLSLINGDDLAYGEIIIDEGAKIGFLRQNPEERFFCNTIYEEILFALKKNRVKNYERRVLESLEIVGLDESYLYRSPFEISKGEQKIVAFAILLACNPNILLLDSPFSNLDFASKKKIIKLLRMMKLKYGKTIIIASDDTDIALELADEVICLKDGDLVFKGNKFDLFTNNKLLKENNITKPRLINFTDLVKVNKGIDIGYRDDINDLMKDIYRFVK